MTPNQNATILRLGMYPLMYGTVWPELTAKLTAMYSNHTSKLPFLPANWLQDVMSIHGKEGWILVPAPAKVNGEVVPLARGSKENADVWQKFSDEARSAVNKYAAGKAAEGKIEMDRLNSEAYWADMRYRLAKVLATPVHMAADAAKMNWGKLALFGGGALLVYIIVQRAKSGGRK